MSQPTAPQPLRITDNPPPRTVAEELEYARAALETTGGDDQNNPEHMRDAAVVLHFRLQRLLDALDAAGVTA